MNNPHVQAGLSWHTIVWAFTSTEQANWHPLTWLSHALDCQLFHLNPAGHHYTNVLLHAVNAVFLFLLLQWTTGSTWRSMMVAALFALHPINVESVAWISERKNVLSMLFFLLALWSYGWYAGKPGVGRYLAVGLLFACGPDGWPMVITFPFRVAALGLLAVAAYVSRSMMRSHLRRRIDLRHSSPRLSRFLAGFGEAAFAGALRRQRSHHHEGTA